MSILSHFYPRNVPFSYEVLRAAGYSQYGGGDLAEIISICSRIPSGDETAWLQEWRDAAHRAEERASTSESVGNTRSAVDAYLSASNYYRTAEFFRRTDPFNDAEADEMYTKSLSTFYKAMDLGPYHCEQVQIPYEGTTLPAYFLMPAGEHKSLKTIIFNGGFDSTKEEAWFALAGAALDRGFAVLAFDGPGQGSALRKQRLFFRPDWEKVLTPVVDYALSRPEVNPDAIIVFGWSMGGLLAARGATAEHRIAALILDDGVYDFGSAFVAQLPGPAKYMVLAGWDTVMDPIIRAKMTISTGDRWGILNGMWTFGLDSTCAFLRATQQYTLEGCCQDIKTSCLILDAKEDHFLKGQPEILAEYLTCEYRLVTLGEMDGAETHCHQGAFSQLHQVIFDWLATRF